MNERTPQSKDKFIVRLPDGLRDRIKIVADANGRSMNSEVVAVLEERFPAPFGDEVTDPGAQFLRGLAAEIRANDPDGGSKAAIQADTYERLAYDLHIRMRSKVEGDGEE